MAQVVLGCRVPHSFAFFANEWALRTARVIKLFDRTRFDLQGPLLIVHAHPTPFGGWPTSPTGLSKSRVPQVSRFSRPGPTPEAGHLPSPCNSFPLFHLMSYIHILHVRTRSPVQTFHVEHVANLPSSHQKEPSDQHPARKPRVSRPLPPIAFHPAEDYHS